jgi:hypothetical protein
MSMPWQDTLCQIEMIPLSAMQPEIPEDIELGRYAINI